MVVAMELPLEQGLRLEKRLFQQLFATQDQKEGELWLQSSSWSQTAFVNHLADNGTYRHDRLQGEAQADLDGSVS